METDLTLMYKKIVFSPTVKKFSRFQITEKDENKSHCSLQPYLQIMMGLAGDE